MTLICFVRHGETEWNTLRKIQGRADIPLNTIGIKQAHECKTYFTNTEWDVLVSSPLQRARQTAEIINEHLNLNIHIMNEFIERNYGDIEGLTLEQRASLYPDLTCPNQESLEQVKERTLYGLNKLHQTYTNQKIIVVAHGGVIKIILSTLSNGQIGLGKTKLTNGSLSNIRFEDGCWKVDNYNQVCHLKEKYNEEYVKY
ncbi:histidine phosphatase family protein [Lysinibacillus endophyticus]|uniref:histidine phosphatase family protein n=1 Tax=Ureibacillus endophyticus TaxID=1978490 RepID=UPI0020A1F0AC|nr:histidine phosphatase family protein [Lysinibacillus endophyticus]MCP1145255.1 histidine phosphatase family protein [Lysinibacillus endophyticus]